MDDKLRIGTRNCKCSGCGEYFTSVGTFDLHRAGTGSNRRCLDPAKMADKKGIARLRKTDRGLWAGTRVY